MEIRLLNGNELQWAVNTVRTVFECSVRGYIRTQQELERFYQYTQVGYLWQEMSQGRLIIWGAFENGRMCAVSGMQSTGRITMLYVMHEFMRRGVGTQMLNGMCMYAANVLRQEKVMVDALPAFASFFYRAGFYPSQGNLPGAGTVVLERQTVWNQISYRQGSRSMAGPDAGPAEDDLYPVRKVKAGVILGITAAVLFLSFALAAGVTIHHMVVDGITSGEVTAGED